MAKTNHNTKKTIAKGRSSNKGRVKHTVGNARSSKVAAPPSKSKFHAWKQLSFVGESLSVDANSREAVLKGAVDARQGRVVHHPYDFSHAPNKIKEHLLKNPDMNAFIFLGTSEAKDLPGGYNMVPNIVVIFVRGRSMTPPPFVAIRREGGNYLDVSNMADFGLSWEPASSDWILLNEHRGRVKVLQSSLRRTTTTLRRMTEEDILRHSSAELYTMDPATEWVNKPNKPDELLIPEVFFQYELPNGESSPVEFSLKNDRLNTFVPAFLEDQELDESHSDILKRAIREAFRRKREEVQRLKDSFLREGYNEGFLSSIETIKIYPQNDFIDKSMRSSYVNPYYRKAVNTDDFAT